MGADDTGDLLFAVKWRPGKFIVVVIEEARGNADTFVRSDVGKRSGVVIAVEMLQMKFRQNTVLHGSQFRLGAAYHKPTPGKVIEDNQVLLCQGVGFFFFLLKAAFE